MLGDRFGSACSPAVLRRVERAFRDLGFRVARNAPYAGGYTTEYYGRPHEGVDALQVEIDRGALPRRGSLAPIAGFAALRGDLERLIAELAARDWIG